MNELKILKSASARFTRDHPNLNLLILFGSRARDDADFSSDWDFAFMYNSNFHKSDNPFWFPGSDILDTLCSLLNLSNNDIDLVDLSRCSEMLAHFISRDGQLIYEKNPGDFANFQKQSLKTSVELKQFRQEQRKNVIQTLQRWGV